MTDTEIVYTVEVVPMSWPWRVHAALRRARMRRTLWLHRMAWRMEPRPWRVARRREIRTITLELIRSVERLCDEYLFFGGPQS